MFIINEVFNMFSIYFYNFIYYTFDVYVLQFILIFSFIQIIVIKNLFYNVLYLFIYIFFWGIYINIFQMELFTAFLWLCEFVVIFILLLFLFYFNPFVKLTFEKLKFNSYFIITPIIFSIIFLILTNFFELQDTKIVSLFNVYIFFDDYYNTLNSYILTDLELSFLMYYYYNSFFLIMFGYILFICSIICVLLNIYINKTNTGDLKTYFNIFDFYKDFIDFLINRKQDLNKQANENAFTKKYYKGKGKDANLRFEKWFKMNEESARKRKLKKMKQNDK